MMAKVHVSVENNSGQTAILGLDDETDAEKIEYFQTLKRRGDIADVHVKKIADHGKKPAAAPRKTEHAEEAPQ